MKKSRLFLQLLSLVIVGSMISIGSQTFIQAIMSQKSYSSLNEQSDILGNTIAALRQNSPRINKLKSSQSGSNGATNEKIFQESADSITQTRNLQTRNALASQDPTSQSEPSDEEAEWFTEGNGTYFEVFNSEYLNITLTSNELVHIRLESIPRVVSFLIGNITAAQTTTLTLSGFEPNTIYYRYEDGYSKGAFTTTLTGEYSYVQDISQDYWVEIKERESTIYINSDGTVTPSTAPINVNGDIYTFEDNIYEQITINKSDIIIDGNGYTLQGTGPGVPPSGSSSKGLWLRWRNNVTIKNIIISGWGYGIWIWNTDHSLITNNVITNCWNGIDLAFLKYCNITYNDVSCRQYGLRVWFCINGVCYIYHNNFICEDCQWKITVHDTSVWYNPELLEGNYWSAYTGLDDGSGTGKHTIAGDGIGDTNLPWPLSWYEDMDWYPFMQENGWGQPNTPPIADAGGPYMGDEGALITFDASGSSDPENDELDYRWDFNNDETWDTDWSTSPYAEFTWYDDFSGEVTVEVSDGEFTATVTAAVTVNNVAPSVEAGTDQAVDEGSLVELDPAGFSDVGVLDTHTAIIDWGDGIVEAGVVSESDGSGTVSGSHTYGDNGVYTVTVTVIDDDGDADWNTLTVTVNNVAPTVSAGTDKTVDEGSLVALDPVGFSDAGVLDTHSAIIDWGDGIVEVGVVSESGGSGTVSGSHTYSDNGIYTVTLTVTDDDGDADWNTLTVTVNNVVPTVSAGTDKTIGEGSLVELDPVGFSDAGVLDTHSAIIDWGDGIVEVGVVSESGGSGTVSGSHTYGDNGIYTVTLTVTDDDGDSGWNTLNINVENIAPIVCIESVVQSQDFVLEDLTVIILDPAYFNGNACDPGSDDLIFTWNWDDSTPEKITTYLNDPPTYPVEIHETVDHTYAEPGLYTVTLTVEDDDSGIGSDTITLMVLGPRDLKKDIILDLESIEPGYRCRYRYNDYIIKHIEYSLAEKYWDDTTHLSPRYGVVVFCHEYYAVKYLEIKLKIYDYYSLQLEKMIVRWEAKGYDTTCLELELDYIRIVIPIYEEIIIKLVKADELIVNITLYDAENTPVKDPKYQIKVDWELEKANEYLMKATDEKANGDYSKAIIYYKLSWKHSQKAIKWANKEWKCYWKCWCKYRR